jgi:hypothetical protein
LPALGLHAEYFAPQFFTFRAQANGVGQRAFQLLIAQ